MWTLFKPIRTLEILKLCEISWDLLKKYFHLNSNAVYNSSAKSAFTFHLECCNCQRNSKINKGTSINRIKYDEVKVDIRLQWPYNNTVITMISHSELCCLVETDIFHLHSEMSKNLLFPCVKSLMRSQIYIIVRWMIRFNCCIIIVRVRSHQARSRGTYTPTVM